MSKNLMKVMGGVLAAAVFGLAGCGGGGDSNGGSSAYDYSKINGKYNCYNMISNTFAGSYQLEFTSTNLKSTNTATNQVQEINDFIGTQNGYPLYTEKVPGSTTDSVGYFFSLPGNDGQPAFYMVRGTTDKVQQGIIEMSLTSYVPNSCKKQ
jgi:hypothetical protein